MLISLAEYKTALRKRVKDLKAQYRASSELALTIDEELPDRDDTVRELRLIRQILRMIGN